MRISDWSSDVCSSDLIAGVERLQPLLVGGVEGRALAVGVSLALAGVDLRRSPAAVLPAVDQAGELAGRPALLVYVGGRDELLQEPELVVGVEIGRAHV